LLQIAQLLIDWYSPGIRCACTHKPLGGRGRDKEKHSVVYNSHSAELMKVNKKEDVFEKKIKILS
jgi:hypothetical protein